ncbi:hypothetical protein G7B40_001430 [Aetokthonos hydrillicola Thurmond2011]|jgi:hypothetical protein|uniref:Uncharacterized protein n=1 Tax=Aetokthonos hydrillicola Thurmond2011 TaxID=2712845 RepID=A0AAP5I3U1_9CYAN|nr:hypothetical protein [Aetokthonos hydrillicola]MBO3463126.1 hypothetical protein [Aetokthonos hydrillicola CCALA 1050]MBW4591090.1 hypothetical protein [Aetokthonos hydrillicola CCALA 1050]MDR9893247.1 hypothetical protein [Aetokthonos hydrillicola Thurmond2011]
MQFLPQVAAAALPAIGQMFNTGAGNAQARVATAGLNTDPVMSTLSAAGIQLDPNQQAALQNHYANLAAQSNMAQSMQSGAYGAGLGNTAANLNTQRAMALNAQANAANNVANQLNALQNRAAISANAINSAMQGAAGLFR